MNSWGGGAAQTAFSGMADVSSVTKINHFYNGEAAIDWSDRGARRRLLSEIVADADWLLELVRLDQAGLPADSDQRQVIVDAEELLGQLLAQDVKRSTDGDGRGGMLMTLAVE